MSEPTPNKSKVTLEELLRLKRHERPPAEYWVRFDRELNERVWRALAQPAPSRTGEVWGWLNRQARWLTVGAVSTLALTLAWLGNYQAPPKFASVNKPVQVASASLTEQTSVAVAPDNNNAQALAAVAENNIPAAVQPVLVAAKVLDSANPAGFNKVPAMLAFASSDGDSVHYATDTLSNPAFSARIRGSAY
jgi:hypothetical protein